jgi:hypothetical protein
VVGAGGVWFVESWLRGWFRLDHIGQSVGRGVLQSDWLQGLCFFIFALTPFQLHLENKIDNKILTFENRTINSNNIN